MNEIDEPHTEAIERYHYSSIRNIVLHCCPVGLAFWALMRKAWVKSRQPLALMVVFIQLGKRENMLKTPGNGQVNVSPLVKVLCSKEYQKSSEKASMIKVLWAETWMKPQHEPYRGWEDIPDRRHRDTKILTGEACLQIPGVTWLVWGEGLRGWQWRSGHQIPWVLQLL